MGISARILGKDYGLNAQEMNQLLKDQDFLDGVPGDYIVTEKGAPFAKETDFHRGSGGYPQYNRDWTQRSWDESIRSVLDTSPERCQAARDTVAEARHARLDARRIAQAEADAAFRASRPDLFPNEQIHSDIMSSDGNDKGLNGLAIAGIVVAGTAIGAGVCYVIHKAAPCVKRWRNKKVVPACSKGKDAH